MRDQIRLSMINCSRAIVDPAQLETALLNLALNGRDAMPDGGTLEIEVAERDSAMTVPSPEPPPDHMSGCP